LGNLPESLDNTPNLWLTVEKVIEENATRHIFGKRQKEEEDCFGFRLAMTANY